MRPLQDLLHCGPAGTRPGVQQKSLGFLAIRNRKNLGIPCIKQLFIFLYDFVLLKTQTEHFYDVIAVDKRSPVQQPASAAFVAVP